MMHFVNLKWEFRGAVKQNEQKEKCACWNKPYVIFLVAYQELNPSFNAPLFEGFLEIKIMHISNVVHIHVDEEYYYIEVGITLNCSTIVVSRELSLKITKDPDGEDIVIIIRH